MKHRSNWVFSIAPRVMFAFAIGLGFAVLVSAQNQEMQERVAEIKAAAARNKQALAQYTWVEQVTISLKGEQKKQESFQVRLGPDGQPQKSLIGAPAPEDPGGRRLKRHIVEKKKEEYKEYAEQIKSLIQRYVPPDRDLIGQAYQNGNILMGPEAGAPGQYRVVISNYIKPGDNMTLIMDKEQKQLVGLSIATYLDDPKDAINVDVQFDQIPGGPNHVSAHSSRLSFKTATTNVSEHSNVPPCARPQMDSNERARGDLNAPTCGSRNSKSRYKHGTCNRFPINHD